MSEPEAPPSDPTGPSPVASGPEAGEGSAADSASSASSALPASSASHHAKVVDHPDPVMDVSRRAQQIAMLAVFYRKHDPTKTIEKVAGIIDRRRGDSECLPDAMWCELCNTLQRKYAEHPRQTLDEAMVQSEEGIPAVIVATLLSLSQHAGALEPSSSDDAEDAQRASELSRLATSSEGQLAGVRAAARRLLHAHGAAVAAGNEHLQAHQRAVELEGKVAEQTLRAEARQKRCIQLQTALEQLQAQHTKFGAESRETDMLRQTRAESLERTVHQMKEQVATRHASLSLLCYVANAAAAPLTQPPWRTLAA